MDKRIVITAIAIILMISCIGTGYAFVSTFNDQQSGTASTQGQFMHVTSSTDWNSLMADGSTTSNVVFHDVHANGQIHPEFVFSGITEDISSHGYVHIHLDGTTDFDFYADVSDVTGAEGHQSFTVVGTCIDMVSNEWTGTMSIMLNEASAVSLSSLMGGSATMTIEAYHLEAAA